MQLATHQPCQPIAQQKKRMHDLCLQNYIFSQTRLWVTIATAYMIVPGRAIKGGPLAGSISPFVHLIGFFLCYVFEIELLTARIRQIALHIRLLRVVLKDLK